MSGNIPGCSVVTVYEDNAEYWLVKAKHYAELQQKVDQKEWGWVELESCWGDGKLLIRVEDIRSLFLKTESYCAARDEYDAQVRLHES